MYFTIFVTPHNFLVERYRPWYTIVFQMVGTSINTNDKAFLRHTLVNYITQVFAIGFLKSKARFPRMYFAAAGEKFHHRKSSFVVLLCRQRKVKQKLNILSNCSRRTNFFSGE
jgi:hypothetical protein